MLLSAWLRTFPSHISPAAKIRNPLCRRNRRRRKLRLRPRNSEALESRVLLTAPSTVDDSYSTQQDMPLYEMMPGVLGNDTDPEFDPLTAVLDTGPSNGTLNLYSDGSFDYTPNSGFTGQDSFTYHANDGMNDGNTATVTIDVTGGGGPSGNSPPSASGDSYTIEWDSHTVFSGVLMNDSDSDGDPLTAVLDTDVTSGSLTLNSDGTFTYARNAGFAGQDSFTYHANDGTDDSNSVTVTLDVIDHFSAATNLPDLPLGTVTGRGPVRTNLQTGDAEVSHAIGDGRQLVYRSITVSQPILVHETDFNATATIPGTVETILTVDGVAGTSVHYNNSGLMGGASVRFTSQFDAGSLTSGRYDADLTIKSHSGNDTATTTLAGSVDVVNWNDSPYGANWNISGLSRLFEQTDGVLLAHSNGASSWFADAGGGSFTSPVGPLSSSTLLKNGDSTFTLTAKTGEREEFDAAGMLTSRVDLNGNTVAFAYVDADTDGDTDDVSTITGVYGRVTTFAYTNGLLSSVTDNAGRVTTITHDGSGRIASITAPDPDGAGPTAAPVTNYAWNADGLLDSVTDPLSLVTQPGYDHGGRLNGITDAMSNFLTYDPIQSDGLVDVDGGFGTAQNPATPVVINGSMSSTYMDSLGNSDIYEVDRFGHVTKHTNALGFTVTYTRDADGNVTTETQPDPDGGGPLAAPVTSYVYDASGNVTQVTLPDGNSRSLAYDATLNRPTSATDELGRVTTFAYDANGNRTSTTDALGNVTSTTFDSHGNVLSVTQPDPDGAGPLTAPVTSYTYDTRGRLTQTTNADGTTTSRSYNSFDQLVSTTNELGLVTTFAYDELDQLLSTTQPDPDGAGPKAAPVSSTTYDAAGRVLTRTDAAGGVTSYSYNALDNVLSVTLPDPDGTGPLSSPVLSYGYDANGRRTSETDAMGNVVTTTYTGGGQLVASVSYPDPDLMGPQPPPQIQYQYDNMGRRTTVIDPLGNSATTDYDSRNRVTDVTDPLGNTVSTTYDAVGNVLTTIDALGNTTSYAYDAMNRTTSITQPDPDGGGPLTAPVTSFTYDNLGRRISDTDPIGSVTSTAYDVMGRVSSVTDPLSNVTTYAYDTAGRRTSITDALGNVTTTAYDSLNRVTSTTDAESGVTSFDYDSLGNRISLTDPVGNTTSWSYDALGRVTQETNELNDSHSFEYNANGQITKRTDRNGRDIVYSYDDLSRQTKEEWLDTDGVTVLHTIDRDYDAASRLTSISDVDSAYAYTYDNAGRVTQTDNSGTVGPHVILDHSYDAAGQRTQLEVNIDGTDDLRNSWTFDNLGRVTRVEQTAQSGGNSVAWKRADLTYNARGQFSTITRSNSTATVVDTTYGYDSNGRLTSLDHDDGASNELASYTWTWDAAGRLTSGTNDDGTSSYTYDDTSQLTGATHSYQTDESYTYDANGNRQMTGYSTGTNNQLLSDGTYNYEYDAEGNRTKKTTIATGDYVEYTWDHRNRLTDVTFKTSTHSVTKKVSYTYDVWNRRLEKKVDTDGDTDIDRSESFLYDSPHPAAHSGDNLTTILLTYEDADGDGAGANALSSRYLHGPAVDQVFADEQASGDLYWLLADHQGTVRDIAEYDDVGLVTNVSNHRTFDSYGSITSETDVSVNTLYGYTSRETDSDVDLIYYRARWYDAAAGQFVSEDPLGFDAGDANVSRYVGNSPVHRTDPSGLDWLDIAANYAAGIGDSLTFGVTDMIREGIGINDGIDHSSTAYIAGEATEIAVEVAVTGGGAALRHAAARIPAGATRRAMSAAARAHARRVAGRRAGHSVHHVNTLFGHPAVRGGRGYRPSLFPSGGLPRAIHNSTRNLRHLDPARHAAAHIRAYRAELLVYYGAHPVLTAGRATLDVYRSAPPEF